MDLRRKKFLVVNALRVRVRVRGFKYYLLNRKKLVNLKQFRLHKR